MKLTVERPFWIKLALLGGFTAAYLPLAQLKTTLPFRAYLAILVGLHIYFVGVLVIGTAWKKMAHRPLQLATRIASVLLLTGALIALGRSPLAADLAAFLTLSFVLHVLMVCALHVGLARPLVTPTNQRTAASTHRS